MRASVNIEEDFQDEQGLDGINVGSNVIIQKKIGEVAHYPVHCFHDQIAESTSHLIKQLLHSSKHKVNQPLKYYYHYYFSFL